MSTPQETGAPFVITKDRRLTMPIALLVTLIITCAVAYARLSMSEATLLSHGAEINDLKTELRQQRELLVRIDENVKDLRRDSRRVPSP